VPWIFTIIPGCDCKILFTAAVDSVVDNFQGLPYVICCSFHPQTLSIYLTAKTNNNKTLSFHLLYATDISNNTHPQEQL
jgi:hypothetical protein